MNDITYGLLSPLLEPKKLLKIFVGLEQTDQNCVTMDVNPCKNTIMNISTKPNLAGYLPAYPVSNDSITQEVRELFARTAQRTYDKELNSERGQQTIAKAIRYNIPFDKDDIDFLGLMDEISDYEFLLKIADELSLDWDERHYDAVALEKAILAAQNDPEHEFRGDNHQFRSDYYASVCVRG